MVHWSHRRFRLLPSPRTQLHCTVLNTIYRRPRAEDRTPFSYPSILASAVLIFALFGATSGGGVVAVAVLFGFSSGACAYPLVRHLVPAPYLSVFRLTWPSCPPHARACAHTTRPPTRQSTLIFQPAGHLNPGDIPARHHHVALMSGIISVDQMSP